MEITPELADGLAFPLNEARLLGIEPNEDEHTVRIEFSVFALPETESSPRSATVTLVLSPVRRIAASYRLGKWNDEGAPAQQFTLSELPAIVRGFGQQDVYGWEFIDPPETRWAHWKERLSLDVDWGSDGRSHVIDLFQEDWTWGKERIFDLRVWFDGMEVFDSTGNEIPLPEFIDDGRRWWAAFNVRDPRTLGHGMYPLRGDPTEQAQP